MARPDRPVTARLTNASSEGFGALVLPLPHFERDIVARLAETTAKLLMPTGTPNAHVTLIGPLSEPDSWPASTWQRIDTIARTTAPAQLTFKHVRPLTPRHTCLLLDDASETGQLRDQLLDVLPPEARPVDPYDEYSPHLTLDYQSDPNRTYQLQAAWAPRLPETVTAVQLSLYWWKPGNTRRLYQWPLTGNIVPDSRQ